MKLRVLIVEESDAIRESLAMHVESLGHEVVVSDSPGVCHNYRRGFQYCIQKTNCGDAIIVGQNFPLLDGIDFIERRVNGGCKGLIAHNAIICRPWSTKEEKRAEILGCTFFETPFKLDSITVWLNKVESNISADIGEKSIRSKQNM